MHFIIIQSNENSNKASKEKDLRVEDWKCKEPTFALKCWRKRSIYLRCKGLGSEIYLANAGGVNKVYSSNLFMLDTC
jgi:hypothetical protein